MSHFTTFVSPGKPEDEICFEAWAESEIECIMEPFWEATENGDYLQFMNVTESISSNYPTEKLNCFKMPNGSVAPCYDPSVKRFTIKNGKVYQKQAGRLKHEKRTARAKKMLALPDYPMNKIFPTIESYAEDYCGYTYDAIEQAYGYWQNPNAFWDWYQIGGRWPFMFLVKEDCPYVIRGERSWATENATRQAPRGYEWVTGARKQDIEWEHMKLIGSVKAKVRFMELEAIFQSGAIPKDMDLCSITENGIVSWGDYLYIKDETLEQYLERNELGPDCKYPVSVYSYVDNGEYFSQGDMGWWGISSNDKPESDWRKMTQDYIENIPDDEFVITIDCHI
jgi:hypothetical protein